MKTKLKRDLIGEVSPPDPPVPVSKRKHSRTLAEGRKPGSGRPVGSKDVELEKMRVAIIHVFEKLGGEAYLLRFAKEFPETFVGKVLNRVLPAVPREPEIEITSNTLAIDSMSDFEVARRIAFILASGQNELDKKTQIEEGRLIEAKPLKPSPAMIPLEPVVFPIQYTEEQLREMAHKGEVDRLVADTRGANSDYGGSAAEQGFHRRRSLI